MSQGSGGHVAGWRRLTPGPRAFFGRLTPGLGPLLRYRRSWLKGDLLAGVTVAAYLVPQVMAYAGVAGLPPVAGLWAILPALALYAVLGSSRLLSVGPESTTALMTATVVGPLAAGDPGRYATLAAALAAAVGLLCLVAWAVRLGFVADLLSRPVLIGYLAGVALIMIVDQLPSSPAYGPRVRRSSRNCGPSYGTCHRSMRQRWCSPPLFSRSCSRWRGSSPRCQAPCWPWCWARRPWPFSTSTTGTASR